jgi:hypothetical protein
LRRWTLGRRFACLVVVRFPPAPPRFDVRQECAQGHVVLCGDAVPFQVSDWDVLRRDLGPVWRLAANEILKEGIDVH